MRQTESLASLCTDYIPRKRLSCLRLHLVLWGLVAVSLMIHRKADIARVRVKDIRCTG